jgi:hypothetical protein
MRISRWSTSGMSVSMNYSIVLVCGNVVSNYYRMFLLMKCQSSIELYVCVGEYVSFVFNVFVCI